MCNKLTIFAIVLLGIIFSPLHSFAQSSSSGSGGGGASSTNSQTSPNDECLISGSGCSLNNGAISATSLSSNCQLGQNGCYDAVRSNQHTSAVAPIDLNAQIGGALVSRCRYVDNISNNDFFVPFRTPGEWGAFISNPPSVNLIHCSKPATTALGNPLKIYAQAPSVTGNFTPDPTTTSHDRTGYYQSVDQLSYYRYPCTGSTNCVNGLPSITLTATFAYNSNSNLPLYSVPWVTTAQQTFTGLDADTNTPSWSAASAVYTTAPPAGCGSASGQSFATAPTSNLCTGGAFAAVSDFTAPGPWAWTCSTYATNNGVASCSTLAQCGSGNSPTDAAKPSYAQQCNVGTPSSITGIGTSANPWAWTCGTGTAQVQCQGSQGTCSPSSVQNGAVAAYPSCTITCGAGYTLSGNTCIASTCSPSSVANGTVAAYPACTISCTTPGYVLSGNTCVLAPSCGTDNGATLGATPTNLCGGTSDVASLPSYTTGVGWTWTCSNNASQTSCAATLAQTYCWNSRAQSLSFTNPAAWSPIPMPAGTSNFTSLSAEGLESANGYCGIADNGVAYCGSFTYSSIRPNAPNAVQMPSGVTNFTSVALDRFSGYTACGIGNNGGLYCWGNNSDDQLGNGTPGVSSTTPVSVTMPSGLTSFTTVAPGYESNCAIGNDGNDYCWGFNQYGGFGNGSAGNYSRVPTPVTMPSGITFTSITGGIDACGLGTNGYVYCWGYGLGGWNYTPQPVSMPLGVTSFTAISAAGTDDICALGNDGEVYCWGYNSLGDFGNGYGGSVQYGASAQSSSVPVAVNKPAGVTSFKYLSTGASQGDNYGLNCAIGNDNRAYCWGGTNSTVISAVPAQIPFPNSYVTSVSSISVGNEVMCMIMQASSTGSTPASSTAVNGSCGGGLSMVYNAGTIANYQAYLNLYGNQPTLSSAGILNTGANETYLGNSLNYYNSGPCASGTSATAPDFWAGGSGLGNTWYCLGSNGGTNALCAIGDRCYYQNGAGVSNSCH